MNDFKAKEGKEPLLTAPLGARAVLFELHAKLTREGDPQVPDKKPSDETSKVSADAAVDVSADARPEEEVEAAEIEVGDPKEQYAALERENRALEEEASRLKALKSTRKDDCEGLRIQLQAIEDEMESFRAAMEKLGQDRLHHIDTLNEGVRQCGEAGTEAVSTIHGAVNGVKQTITITATEAAAIIKMAGEKASKEIQGATIKALQETDAIGILAKHQREEADRSRETVVQNQEALEAKAKARLQASQDREAAANAAADAAEVSNQKAQKRLNEARAKSAELDGWLKKAEIANITKPSLWKKSRFWIILAMLAVLVFGVPLAMYVYMNSSKTTVDESASDQSEQATPAASSKHITPAASAVPAVATTDSGKPEGLVEYVMDEGDMARKWPTSNGKGGEIYQFLNPKKGAANILELLTCPVLGNVPNRFHCGKREIKLECQK